MFTPLSKSWPRAERLPVSGWATPILMTEGTESQPWSRALERTADRANRRTAPRRDRFSCIVGFLVGEGAHCREGACSRNHRATLSGLWLTPRKHSITLRPVLLECLGLYFLDGAIRGHAPQHRGDPWNQGRMTHVQEVKARRGFQGGVQQLHLAQAQCLDQAAVEARVN